MPLVMTAAEDDSGRRLDRVLRKSMPDLPLSAIHRLLRKGAVMVDGETAAADFRILPGQTITIKSFSSETQVYCAIKSGSAQEPEKKTAHDTLEILYEEKGIIILNKPSGLPVHGRNSLDDLVQSYLLPRLPSSLSFKPGPLHRLDRPCSGVIVFSTNIDGARVFSALMRDGSVKKKYVAIAEGIIKKAQVWRDELIRDSKLKKTLNATETTKSHTSNNKIKTAITRVTPIKQNGLLTLFLANIETGRTHQIRSQAAAHGHPLWGDMKYGAGFRGNIMLHAWRLEIPEPFNLSIEAPIPENFQKKNNELFGITTVDL
ncbi:MAG: RluA family pseudouridine synthase [Treponema sp.]|jgi:23S rRNA pseudouridine955/2504/2580 synthase|nr:RluA family pseudouridine synthase [Treponema sp.]